MVKKSTDFEASHYNLLTYIHDHIMGSSWCDVPAAHLLQLFLFSQARVPP